MRIVESRHYIIWAMIMQCHVTAIENHVMSIENHVTSIENHVTNLLLLVPPHRMYFYSNKRMLVKFSSRSYNHQLQKMLTLL